MQLGDTWSWYDDNETYHIAKIEDACSYNYNNNGDGLILGLTKPLHDIQGLDKVYHFMEDMKIKICLNKSASSEENYKWNFNIENLRIPIISDVCYDNFFVFDDLVDGLDETVLNEKITNCKQYFQLMKFIDYYAKGSYRQPEYSIFSDKDFTKNLDYIYNFSRGVKEHEYKHFIDDSTEFSKAINNKAFPEIRNNKKLKKDFACPEDALDFITKSRITSSISNSIELVIDKQKRSFTTIKTNNGDIFEVKTWEINADEYAEKWYKNVKKIIKNWARSKSWFLDSYNCTN